MGWGVHLRFKREVVKIPLRPILLAKKRCKTTDASARRRVCMLKGLRPTFIGVAQKEACESQHESECLPVVSTLAKFNRTGCALGCVDHRHESLEMYFCQSLCRKLRWFR